MARKQLTIKHIDINTVKKELETSSILKLSEEYGCSREHFRKELNKLNIKSPRLPGHKIARKAGDMCICGNKRMSDRKICSDCRNKKRRESRANKIPN